MSDMSDDTDGQVEAGRWATIAEAALHYRRVARTIERWVETGRLKRHPTALPTLVWLPSSDSPTPESDVSGDNVGQAEAAEEAALARVERLYDIVRQQTSPLTEALARAELRASQAEALALILARENGQQQERIAALERVADVVRQMSDAAEARAITSEKTIRAQAATIRAAEVERDAALKRLADAEGERDRLKRRRWWRPW